MHTLVAVTLIATLAAADKPVSDVCAGVEKTPGSVAIDAAEAAALEAKLALDPDRAEARARLVAYYSRAATRDPALRARGLPHLRWLVSRCPRAELLGSPMAGSLLVREESDYRPLQSLWMEQVERNPTDTAILLHAAAFIGRNDLATTEGLLERATAADPTCARCWSQLAHTRELASRRASGAEGTAILGKALAAYERALAAASSPEDRFADLPQAAKAAFAAGQMETAERHARELLAMAGEQPGHWNEGNAIHHGNLILGRIALGQGRKAEARERLLAAGRAPASPQLRSFGPNMALAQDLLAAGDPDTVLEYFKLCGKSWTMGRGKLKTWSDDVTAGRPPDFGANLLY